jgi:RNA polymerase sigma-70 factor (ECF subfamily)
MSTDEPASRLSRIETMWTVVRQACAADPDQTPAREQLYERYAGAVHRYLLGALRDEHAADEVFQEFWVRFLRGYFRNANPQKGWFRSLLKSALFRQVLTYRQQRAGKQHPRPLGVEDAANLAVADPEDDQAFTEGLRQELLDRAWLALEREDTKQPLYLALRLKADCPESSSDELAEKLTVRLGRPITADSVRQALKRARDRFADLLVIEVSRSLESTDFDDLVTEVAELGLTPYCQSALDQRRLNSC